MGINSSLPICCMGILVIQDFVGMVGRVLLIVVGEYDIIFREKKIDVIF